MKVIYKSPLTEYENNLAENISAAFGVLKDTARLLIKRGISSVEEAKRFLFPGRKNFNDPYLLDGMKEAAERISRARDNGEKVLIFGDYDADGVCATTVLRKCLVDFGIEPIYVIPEREEGYGLNRDKIDELGKGEKINLIITVDCGISDYEKIEEIKAQGIDVIVTDHHEPPEILPDCIRINPKIEGQKYPFKELCGAGVAYKLGCALIGEKADKYLDYVALATVADSMDLVGENRDILAEGLKLYNSDKIRKEFAYLIGDGGKEITSRVLAYAVAPRINAGGRIGDAFAALKLFNTDDDNEKFDLAVQLNSYNALRQAECDRTYNDAVRIINEKQLYLKDFINVCDISWKAGIIGIVAARLVEDYQRPVIVFAGQDGFYKGSARSVENINVYDAINSCSDLLETFGGHSQAAGLSIKADNFAAFDERINGYVKDLGVESAAEKTVMAEWEIKDGVSERFAREINLLEPFGVANQKPYFAVKEGVLCPTRIKAGSPHFSVKTSIMEMMYFSAGDKIGALRLPVDKTVVFEINLSVFKGREYLKGYIKTVVPELDDISEEQAADLDLCVFDNELLKARDCFNGAAQTENLQEENVLPQVIAQNGKEGRKLYCLLSAKDLRDTGGLPKSVFYAENSDKRGAAVLSPKEIPDLYDEVIYRHKTLCYIGKNKKVENSADYPDYFYGINLEREAFAAVYAVLCGLVGKEYVSAYDLYEKYRPTTSGRLFILATHVFFELGFFSAEDGILRRDTQIKKPLDSSFLYNFFSMINARKNR